MARPDGAPSGITLLPPFRGRDLFGYMRAMNFAYRPPQTPALVIDRAALLHNLRTMQAACDAGGVRLRAHGKMHKCSTLARLQVETGAVGLCCQTVGEAESFARAGVADLLVSAPLAPWAPLRLATLARETGARIAATCDSEAQIARLGVAALASGVELGCVIDVNIGMHRVGCTTKEAPRLAALAVATQGLRYEGVQAYFGHLQHLEGRTAANAAGTAKLAALVETLRGAGLTPAQVTGGGTGTYALDIAAGVFTELQCGSYAVMDAEYADCGAPAGEWPFRPALFIAASAVSAKHKTHVTIDVGLKASSFDVPPRIIAGAAPGSQWRSLGDEHGAIVHPSARTGDVEKVDPDDAPREGDIVWLQPGHCDPTINLYDAFLVVDDEGRTERWPIDARRVSR
jgi:3-hydroxy-D-aspartate aldolase